MDSRVSLQLADDGDLGFRVELLEQLRVQDVRLQLGYTLVLGVLSLLQKVFVKSRIEELYQLLIALKFRHVKLSCQVALDVS